MEDERGQRTVPIEPALLPLLNVLRGQGTEIVALLLSRGEDRNAGIFRGHLAAAGVTRARLTADKRARQRSRSTSASLRDSYATWLVLAGLPDKRIQRRLGHASNSTTDRYIKTAEALDIGALSEPFPRLPPTPSVRPTRGHKTTKPRTCRGLFSCAGRI